MTTKTLQARSVRVGDSIMTSIGMREVLEITDKSKYGLRLVIQDPYDRDGKSALWFDTKEPVTTRRAAAK